MSNDWREFHRRPESPPAVVDPQRRLRLVQAGMAALLLILFARAVQLELTQGAAFREAASQPLRRTTILPAPRGRILAADGTVLACDREVAAVAVQYRWLQDPPDARWLRQTAQASLSTSERKDPARVAAAETLIRRERSDLARRLAGLCGATSEQWTRRERAVQERVERIAVGHGRVPAEVAEERASHILADDAPAVAVAEIEGHPERYPGAKIVRRLRRLYPCGELAAHVLGYVVPAEDRRDGEPAGRDGVERQYDRRLRGRNGASVQLTDHAGRALTNCCETKPRAGGDLRLTILPKLQQTAERLLDDALERRAMQPGKDEPGGGAVAVMDLRDGGLLAAASAPRFDPNIFISRGNAARIQTLLHAPDRPMFDRVVQMALPPGSTFKVLTAVALLEFGAVDPQETFHCQGYLRKPNGDAMRDLCPSRRRPRRRDVGRRPGPKLQRLFFPLRDADGTGTAGRLGEAAGLRTSDRRRLAGRGFGDRADAAVDRPPGRPRLADLRHADDGHRPRRLDRHAAPGVAPGGRDGDRRTHHAATWRPSPGAAQPIKGLRPATLAAIRRGMERAVADPKGTAYGALAIESLAVAAKTGTASVGQGRRDHAWLAGYAPAEAPKFAFIIVLEHAGDAAAAAGPVAKRLLLRMRQLGLLVKVGASDASRLPPIPNPFCLSATSPRRRRRSPQPRAKSPPTSRRPSTAAASGPTRREAHDRRATDCRGIGRRVRPGRRPCLEADCRSRRRVRPCGREFPRRNTANRADVAKPAGPARSARRRRTRFPAAPAARECRWKAVDRSTQTAARKTPRRTLSDRTPSGWPATGSRLGRPYAACRRKSALTGCRFPATPSPAAAPARRRSSRGSGPAATDSARRSRRRP